MEGTRGAGGRPVHGRAGRVDLGHRTAGHRERLYNNPLAKPFLASADKGAEQLVWLAETAPGASWQSGHYYGKQKIATRVDPQAEDAQLAVELWHANELMCR